MKDYMPTLSYRADSQVAPIPPHEMMLQTITAEPWLHVSDEPLILEGVSFDREGNMWFIEDVTARVHKVNMETKEDQIIYEDKLLRGMSASKHHKDGRVFIPSVGDQHYGYIFTMNPDGTDYKVLLEGHVFDDIVFDSDGGFYYTHFIGNVGTQSGGVYYVYPDHKTVVPVVEGLAAPNGVALSTNENRLWVTEHAANRLLRFDLASRTEVKPFGGFVTYQFTGGGGCDSCYVDADDNVYVAMANQGRVMVFNRDGWPIGQVLLKGRENAPVMLTTHPCIRPGTNELYICTSDGGRGADIYRCGAFAGANMNAFHLK